jgi:hypothetical protein
VIFSTNIIETPKFSRDRAEKTEREKEKLQKSLQIKGKLASWEEKDALTSKILFNVIPFSTPPSYISKTLSKIIEKIFLTLFGPSFSLAIYMTLVVPFLLTHELHIFSQYRVGWEGTIIEPRWGTTYQKECLSV